MGLHNGGAGRRTMPEKLMATQKSVTGQGGSSRSQH